MPYAAPLRSELFVEGNEFAGLTSFSKRICDILAVRPTQEIGSPDQPFRHYFVCQTMDVRLVLGMAEHGKFPYCNYCISVENELAVPVSYGFIVIAADAIARRLAAAKLKVVRLRQFDRILRRVLRYSIDTGNATGSVVTIAGKPSR